MLNHTRFPLKLVIKPLAFLIFWSFSKISLTYLGFVKAYV